MNPDKKYADCHHAGMATIYGKEQATNLEIGRCRITMATLGILLLLECSTLAPVDMTLPKHGGYALGLHAQKQGRKALALLSAQLKQAKHIIDVQTQLRSPAG